MKNDLETFIMAFCNDIPKYPEKGMRDEFLKYGIKIVSGNEALELIKKKEVLPENVYVVQEILAESAAKLLKLGAKPFLLTSGEAEIYAPLLYDNLENIANKFQHKILYRGAFERLGGINPNNHVFYFPVESNNGFSHPIIPWGQRKEIVMVVANKFCKLKFPTTIQPKNFMRKLKTFFSPSFRYALENNFQTKRLEAIGFWGNLKKLDLYGGRWNKKTDIPSDIWKKIEPLIPQIYKGRCKDKIEVISNYKFAIAFENSPSAGYVTEKIIDCFVAGVIPIYLGAPDIQEFIPENCFIDARNFENFEDLDNYLQSIDEKKAMELINNGRNFLQSENGKKYSMQYFIKFVANLFNEKNLAVKEGVSNDIY